MNFIIRTPGVRATPVQDLFIGLAFRPLTRSRTSRRPSITVLPDDPDGDGSAELVQADMATLGRDRLFGRLRIQFPSP